MNAPDIIPLAASVSVRAWPRLRNLRRRHRQPLADELVVSYGERRYGAGPGEKPLLRDPEDQPAHRTSEAYYVDTFDLYSAGRATIYIVKREGPWVCARDYQGRSRRLL